MSAERRRLALALLLSLLFHALLLSLTFGGQGLGLPGFGFPWRERRIEAPDLRVLLVPSHVPGAEPARTSFKEPLQPPNKQPAPRRPAQTLSVSPAPTRSRTAEAALPKAKPTAKVKPAPGAATGAARAKAPLLREGAGDVAPKPIPGPEVIARDQRDEVALAVPAAPVPTPVIGAAPGASSPETVTPAPRDAGDAAQERVDPEARERAAEPAKVDRSAEEAQRQGVQQEAARIEAARLDSERQEAERLAAARREAARVEAARREAERVRNAQLEAERQDAARQAAARQEAAQQEAARREAERVEIARQEAERQEAVKQQTARQEAAQQEAARREAERVEIARQEAERQEVGKQQTARQEAARLEAAREEEARREERLRAIGRQLDEEAARRDAASNAASLPDTRPYSLSTARRGRLWGRTDPNPELIRYAEAWARKIELNMTFDMVREAAKRPHVDPLVTVAIRNDGSVESVTFVRSSGVAEIDEAIRRIVQSQVPYQPFPPALAREYDVIEIRRTWHFDMAVRMY